MSCDIGLGRLEVCKDTIGGLRAVYFGNFGDITTVTYDMTDTDVIDAVTGDPDAFKYDLKGSSSFTETVVSSRETGTTVFGIRQSALREISILVPSIELQELATETLDSIFEQKEVLQKQNQKLKQARDILLPKLMNGEIEV
jgi:type I restriction enzyme S subunit